MTVQILKLPIPRWDIISITIALHLGVVLAFLPGTFSWAAVGVGRFRATVPWVPLDLFGE